MAAGTVRMAMRRALALRAGTTLVIGVSGGVDSLVLLHAAIALRDSLHLTVIAATLDHGLRADVGAADAAYVEQIAHAWGVLCVRGALDAARYREGLGVEAAARAARYDFLADAARQHQASVVAVGHHADDQAETVLAHLVRGAGLIGLASMRAESSMPGHADVRLLRPLLDVRRADIESYAQAHVLVPREDASNADITYTRNRIRHVMLPLLASFNTQIVPALVRLADNAAVESDFIESALDGVLDTGIAQFAETRVTIERRALCALAPALARRLIVRAAAHLAPSDDSGITVTHERVLAAVEQARDGDNGAMLDMGHGLHLHITHTRIIMQK